MATDLLSPFPQADDLAPAPRPLPFRLWCHLLAGPVTLGGSALFAFGMVFALIFAPATDPVGTWRLAQRRQEAPGWVQAATETRFHEGGGEDEEGVPIYRYDYTFTLPEGTPINGSSYTVGQQFQVPPAVPVTVEYDPQHPDTNRIRGTRTSPYPPGALLVVLFPAVGLVIALAGLVSGRRRARLLRDGECVPATITACQFGVGDSGTYLPVSEYKHRWACLRHRFGDHPLVPFAGVFLRVWTLMATVFLVVGTIFCVVALGFVLVVPMPAQERSLFALGSLGFLILWGTVGVYMVRAGWRGCWATSGGGGEPAGRDPVRCEFEFRLPDGEVVRARAPGRLTDGPGAEPPQPALYDPRRPTRALLLSGLWPAGRVGPFGAWETPAGVDAIARALLVLLLLAGPLVVWASLR
jgi:Protein of unknown function (DUF3592)